jgi:peptidoglycan/LPS O-acetylase OafA/YrhL
MTEDCQKFLLNLRNDLGVKLAGGA